MDSFPFAFSFLFRFFILVKAFFFGKNKKNYSKFFYRILIYIYIYIFINASFLLEYLNQLNIYKKKRSYPLNKMHTQMSGVNKRKIIIIIFSLVFLKARERERENIFYLF